MPSSAVKAYSRRYDYVVGQIKLGNNGRHIGYEGLLNEYDSEKSEISARIKNFDLIPVEGVPVSFGVTHLFSSSGLA